MSKKSKDSLPTYSARKRTPSPTPPSSIKSFASETTLTTHPAFLPPVEQSLFYESRIRSSLEVFFDWALKLIGVASAVVFGIWAPVSYRLQQAGNKSNDDAQERLVEQVDGLKREVEGLRKVVSGLGSLRVWEFCGVEGNGREGLEACKALRSSFGVNALLEDMMMDVPVAHLPSSGGTASTPRPTPEKMAWDSPAEAGAPTATHAPDAGDGEGEKEAMHDELGVDYPNNYGPNDPVIPLIPENEFWDLSTSKGTLMQAALAICIASGLLLYVVVKNWRRQLMRDRTEMKRRT